MIAGKYQGSRGAGSNALGSGLGNALLDVVIKWHAQFHVKTATHEGEAQRLATPGGNLNTKFAFNALVRLELDAAGAAYHFHRPPRPGKSRRVGTVLNG